MRPPARPSATSTSGATPTRNISDARIIFTDTEKSNWTWDPVAQAYFWHRFFSHQPDLNYDNPQVVEEMLNVMRYLAGHGRGCAARGRHSLPGRARRHQLRESSRNAPADQAVCAAKSTRTIANRMILAEANQWPTDVRPYFGDGDECHMAFHFPLMPRIYMALRQEDRLPITDIMAQTPAIPDTCQWGLFLRNHDELTLEMVTNDERDYMYLAYSADPRMRVNLGIRRRLAPLAGQQPPPHRAAQQPAVFLSRHAHPLLRRRNRHGRQHLPGRPQRRPHAHAVECRPQRRLLARQCPPSSTAPSSWTRSGATRPSTSRRSRAIRLRC